MLPDAKTWTYSRNRRDFLSTGERETEKREKEKQGERETNRQPGNKEEERERGERERGRKSDRDQQPGDEQTPRDSQSSPIRRSRENACSDLSAASVRTPLVSGDRTTDSNGETNSSLLKPRRSDKQDTRSGGGVRGAGGVGAERCCCCCSSSLRVCGPSSIQSKTSHTVRSILATRTIS